MEKFLGEHRLKWLLLGITQVSKEEGGLRKRKGCVDEILAVKMIVEI